MERCQYWKNKPSKKEQKIRRKIPFSITKINYQTVKYILYLKLMICILKEKFEKIEKKKNFFM